MHMQFLLGNVRIALDHSDGDITFISHAHSDHLNGVHRKKQVIASKETLDLADLDAEIILPNNIRLLDSGHILGSKQLLVDSNGKRMVYTGDIRTRKSILFKPAEISECDKLIIDATYADPNYKFPNGEEIYTSLARWVKENDDKNLIIGCYDLGKAQELIRILNQYASITPVVNENVERFCHIYGNFGIKLERHVIGSREAEEIMKRRFVALVSMKHAKRYFAKKLSEAFGRKTLCAVATGWALHYHYDVDNAFPLSDHADFYDLKEYIEQTSAKEIEFHSGDGSAILKACDLEKTDSKNNRRFIST